MGTKNEARAAVCDDHTVKMRTWGFDVVSFMRAQSSAECWFCLRSGPRESAEENFESPLKR